MGQDFAIVVGAGSLASGVAAVVRFPHRWTEAGVAVQADFTGAHLVHLAVAGCVLNDTYREAERLGVPLDGVRVTASGGFDTDTWASTGIGYTLELDSPALPADLDRLRATVDDVAEIPRAIRQGAPVRNRPAR
jgi:uncharacterized OsmC-like protein